MRAGYSALYESVQAEMDTPRTGERILAGKLVCPSHGRARWTSDLSYVHFN
jgi:hypothetical protein